MRAANSVAIGVVITDTTGSARVSDPAAMADRRSRAVAWPANPAVSRERSRVAIARDG
jgi:hypothetical protein